MGEPQTVLLFLAAATLGLIILAAASLRAWKDWLELKRLQIDASRGRSGTSPSPASRTELAELKRRVGKLEAIASGVDF